MPDHVHVVVTPYEETELGTVMRRMKGASCRFVNELLRRSGVLWQAESFDRIVRSAESLEQKVAYVLDNPVRAGLVERWQDYPWSWRPDGREP